MGKIPAKIISVLFHPLLLPSIGILILFNSGTILEYLPIRAMKIIFLIVFVSTAILPLTFVPFFIFQKVIKNIHMESSKERLIPFFITSFLYFFCFYLQWQLQLQLESFLSFRLNGKLVRTWLVLVDW